MVLGLREDVQAEDALQERRVAEGDDAVPLVAEFEPNPDLSTFDVCGLEVKSVRCDLLLG